MNTDTFNSLSYLLKLEESCQHSISWSHVYVNLDARDPYIPMELSLTRLVCLFRARYSVFTTLRKTNSRATNCLQGPKLLGTNQSCLVPLSRTPLGSVPYTSNEDSYHKLILFLLLLLVSLRLLGN